MNRTTQTRTGGSTLFALAFLLAAMIGGWASGSLAAADGAPQAPYRLPADGSWAEIWCESPMRKAFPLEQPPLRRGEEIVLWAARGESEPAQIVVRPVRVAGDGTFNWTAERGAQSVELAASSGVAHKSLTVPL